MECKFKIDMFLTSFIPLWLAIIVYDIWEIVVAFCNQATTREVVVSITVILLILIMIIPCMIDMIGVLNRRKSNENTPRATITEVSLENKLSPDFLIAYILPMAAFDFSNLRDVIIFAILFATLAFLCVRNNNVYVNILLEIMGYKLYRCDIEEPRVGKNEPRYDCLVISRIDLVAEEGESFPYYLFDDDVYLDVRKKEGTNDEAE